MPPNIPEALIKIKKRGLFKKSLEEWERENKARTLKEDKRLAARKNRLQWELALVKYKQSHNAQAEAREEANRSVLEVEQ